MAVNWTCRKCQAYNHPRRQTCWQCGAPTALRSADDGDRSRVLKWAWVSVGGIVLCAVLILMVLAAPSIGSAVQPAETLTPLPTEGPPQIAQPETLESYRSQLKVMVESGNVSQSAGWTITSEWVKKSQTGRTVMSMEGATTPAQQAGADVEMIAISNTTWLRVGDTWTQVDSQKPLYRSLDLLDLGEYLHALKLVSKETVNNVRCKNYAVDDNIIRVSNPDVGDMTVRAQGNVWIADQPDLPSVIVRMRLRVFVEGMTLPMPIPSPISSSQALEPSKLVFRWEYDVTAINSPIVIEPPKSLRKP